MSRSHSREARSGFTLIELAVALLVAGMLLGAFAMPLAAQLQARRFDESRRQLEAVRDALLAHAAAHGRLPCPATEASRGQERFAAGGGSLDGECERFHDGFLPAATLGLAALDAEGFLQDPWGGRANRLRYAVAANTVNGVPRAFTRARGVAQATLAGLGAADHFLVVCGSAEGAGPSACGSAAVQLTRKAVFVVLSAGPNAASTEPPTPDERRNLDGGALFVAREPGGGPGRTYDDVVTWAGVPQLAHHLLAAGRLP